MPKRSGAPSRFEQDRNRSAVVAPDPARAPSATSSKFWGVLWDKSSRRWKAEYRDAEGKKRYIGRYDTQEDAAHAVNAAIRRAGLEGLRYINPVVDGALVPKQPGTPTRMNYGSKKRRRDEPAATCTICLDPTTVKLVCGHAMCEECMGRLAVFQGQTLTRSRRRVVIQCPLRCLAPTERVLA